MQFMGFVLIEKAGRYLLIQEASDKHQGQWYLPGGKAEESESPAQAAMRETFEEAGCEPVLNGIFYIKHSKKSEAKEKLIVYFDGSVNDSRLKTKADEHSLSAGWFSYSEIQQLTLRDDALEIIDSWLRCKNSLLPISNFTLGKKTEHHA